MKTPPTRREMAVLVLYAEGLTREAVARRMGIATNTVKTHTQRLLYKLGARNRAHAVHIAYQRGYLLTSRKEDRHA